MEQKTRIVLELMAKVEVESSIPTKSPGLGDKALTARLLVRISRARRLVRLVE